MSHTRPTRKHPASAFGEDGPIGYFINLDRSRDRRRRVESELAKVGLAKKYKRFAAIDGHTLKLGDYGITPSEAGCFLSHLGVLKAGQKTNRHFHVLEDDAILSRNFAIHLKSIMGSVIGNFDIVFTDMWLPIDQADVLLSMYKEYVTRGILTVIADNYAACTASYVVNINAAGKLIRLLGDEVRSGMKSPLDLYIGNLVASGAVKIGCLFPFVSSIRMDSVMASTISRPREPAAKSLIADVPRAAFYVEADLKAVKLDIAGISVTDLRLSIEQQSAIRLLDAVMDVRCRIPITAPDTGVRHSAPRGG
jgi:GR25 family glycosyltransferase involved in LPS biosynthesis